MWLKEISGQSNIAPKYGHKHMPAGIVNVELTSIGTSYTVAGFAEILVCRHIPTSHNQVWFFKYGKEACLLQLLVQNIKHLAVISV